MKIFFIINIIFFQLHPVFAQIDSTINLNEVTISSARFNTYNNGLHQYSFDSTLISKYRHQSLSELLDENTSVYLKNYGHGELSSISLRGGSSYQTSVLWNGFALNSALNGLTDLSMQNNFFFDDVSIQFGGTSSSWGSGAVSGSIHLDNRPLFNTGIRAAAGLSAGSFSDFTQYAGVSLGGKIFSGSIKFFHEDCKNDFNYINPNSGKEEKQVNAAVNQFGIMTENYLMTGKNSILNLKIWYTLFDRQIPPSLYQSNVNANQKDNNLRSSIEWKTVKEHFEFSIRSAYFNEKETYKDDYLPVTANNNCQTSISEAAIEKKINENHHLQLGINDNYSATDSSANLSAVSVNRFAIFAFYSYISNNKKIGFSLSARKEYSSLTNSPLVYSSGINYYPVKSIQVRLSYSKVYRNPTLNDLYWNPGGDENLKPENGYSAEAGIHNNLFELLGIKKKTASSISIDGTFYYKNIDDWIIWYPSQSYIWRPQNLLNVKSQGVELSGAYKFIRKSLSTGCELNYYYTISTNEKSQYANDASIGKQLIYVPVHRLNFHCYINWRTWGIHFNHSYTGIRYTATDNSEFLDPYTLENIKADKSIAIGSTSIRLFFCVNNLLNTDYESVQSRPMPLQSYCGGISFNFQKNQNKK